MPTQGAWNSVHVPPCMTGTLALGPSTSADQQEHWIPSRGAGIQASPSPLTEDVGIQVATSLPLMGQLSLSSHRHFQHRD